MGGLDITAYSHMQAIGLHTKDPKLNEGEPCGIDDWCFYDDHFEVFAYADFPRSFRGFATVATPNRGGGFIYAGCYQTTADTVTHDFHAGSYGGYNRWREDLRNQFNPGHDPNGPFYELIWFADNEGSIGPEAAADLLVDFRTHADEYAGRHPHPGVDDWYKASYVDWTRAFELAADGGLVRFH